MIQNITIENFRQFDYLEVKDLKRVNFLVGKNNCGKTTVLEALFIMTNPQNHESWAKISIFRGILINKELILNVFRNFQETHIKLSIKINNEKCSLLIQPKKDNIISFETAQLNGDKQPNKTYLYNITVVDKNNNSKTYDSLLSIDSTNISLNITKPFQNPYGSGSYLPDSLLVTLNDQIETLYKNSQEQTLKEEVRLFNDQITNVLLIGNNVYFEMNGVRLPSQLMGDGLKKYTNIVSTLLEGKCKYLLIDEIENGLHHITQRTLLKAILRLSKEKNIQLFITTHSLETLTFLSEIMKEDEFNTQKDDVQVINIANTKLKGFIATNYFTNEVQNLIENESEVRG